LVEAGRVEPSPSPWASPIVLVPKKDGKTRFCLDYRKLNEIPTKDIHLLPRMDDAGDGLTSSRIQMEEFYGVS